MAPPRRDHNHRSTRTLLFDPILQGFNRHPYGLDFIKTTEMKVHDRRLVSNKDRHTNIEVAIPRVSAEIVFWAPNGPVDELRPPERGCTVHQVGLYP